MPAPAIQVVRQLHPDTYNYLDRVRQSGGEIADHRIDALNRFVVAAYNLNLRSRTGSSTILYLLPVHLTRSFAGCNVPLWAPSGVGNAVNNNYVASDWNQNGLAGGTKHFNSNFNPNTHIPVSSSCSLFKWLTAVNTTTNAVTCEYGCFVTGNRFTNYEYFETTPFYEYFTVLGGTAGTYALPAGPVTGLQLGNRTSTTVLRNLRNNVLINESSTSYAGGLPNLNIFWGARNNNGTPERYLTANHRWSVAGIGSGLTTQQETDLYNLLLALN